MPAPPRYPDRGNLQATGLPSSPSQANRSHEIGDQTDTATRNTARHTSSRAPGSVTVMQGSSPRDTAHSTPPRTCYLCHVGDGFSDDVGDICTLLLLLLWLGLMGACCCCAGAVFSALARNGWDPVVARRGGGGDLEAGVSGGGGGEFLSLVTPSCLRRRYGGGATLR